MDNVINCRQLTNSEAHIYDYIQKHTAAAENMSIRQLASASFSSPASVMRLVRKMGYTGYAEFQYRFRNHISGAICSPADEREYSLSRFFEVTVHSDSYLRSLREAADLIAGRKEILFAGDSYGSCVLEAGIHLFRSPERRTEFLEYRNDPLHWRHSALILIIGNASPQKADEISSYIPGELIPVIMICCGGHIPVIPCRKIICRETDEHFSSASSLIPAVHTLELLRKAVDSRS